MNWNFHTLSMAHTSEHFRCSIFLRKEADFGFLTNQPSKDNYKAKNKRAKMKMA